MHTETDERLKDWMAAIWFAPLTLNVTLFECMATTTHSWMEMLFSPNMHHEPEKHTDLEVPEPIEESGESELFA